jgi:uncharacterized membrane protein YhaH (DUF805 family)
MTVTTSPFGQSPYGPAAGVVPAVVRPVAPASPPAGHHEPFRAPDDADVPLWEPLYGATPGQALGRFFRKYRDFTGRASLSEYWWAVGLQHVVVSALLGATYLAVSMSGAGDSLAPAVFVVLGLLVVLGTIFPSYAVLARRLQDAGFNRNFILLTLVPLGGIVPFVMSLLPAKAAGARFDRPRL